MADKRFTDFDSRVQLLTGDFFVGYKEDGSAEFRTRLIDLVEALRPFFAPLPAPTPTPTGTPTPTPTPTATPPVSQTTITYLDNEITFNGQNLTYSN